MTSTVPSRTTSAASDRSVFTNPAVFVVGCPRSGTTLLQRMLDHHPQLAVTNDTHFIPRVIKDCAVGVDPELTPQLVEAVRTYRRIHRLKLSDEQMLAAADGARTYSAYVANLYDLVADGRGKARAGEKTPDYVRCLPRLHGLFPTARMIHIIRDGRDVALSTLQWATPEKGPGRLELWNDEPLAVCALWWRWNVGQGRRDGRALPTDVYREVSYEPLAARPAAALEELVEFLHLPFSDAMETFHVGRAKPESSLSAKSAWLPATPGLRDWRSQMDADDVALFEAIAGDLLESCGYDRVVESIPDAVAARARDCIAWWESNKGPLPRSA